jgi:hypothetical protein
MIINMMLTGMFCIYMLASCAERLYDEVMTQFKVIDAMVYLLCYGRLNGDSIVLIMINRKDNHSYCEA